MIPELVLVAFLAGLFLIGLGGAMVVAASMVSERHRFTDPEKPKLVLKCVGASVVTFGVLSWVLIITGAVLANNAGNLNPFFGIALVPIAIVFGAVGLSGLSAFHAARLIGTEMTDRQVNELERRVDYLRSAGWCLVVLGFISPMLPFGILILACLFLAAAVSGGNVRAKQGTLLWLLTILVEKNLPLADEVEALADTFRGGFRTRTKRLAEVLRSGDKLSHALHEIPGLVPQYAVIAADIGEKTENLGPALREAAQRHSDELTSRSSQQLGGLILYWWVVFSVLNSIVGFLMINVIPKFIKIFADFGTPLPPATETLIDVVIGATDYFYLWAPFVLVPVGGILVAGLAQLIGWDRIRVGWFGQFFLRMDTPVILRSLGITVGAKQPLEFGVDRIADRHRRGVVRQRLNNVFYAIKGGDDCWEAMRRQRFITKHERALLQAAQRAGNLSWALSELAGTIERRIVHRLRQLSELLQPVLVLFVGLNVLFICLAFFMPIINLITSLS